MVDDAQPPPEAPSALWRAASTLTVGAVGTISRAFLKTFSKLEVNGLDDFTKLLEERRDVQGRERGLITVSNHLTVIDDPFIWGALPLRFLWSPDNMRWSLGSHDIAYKDRRILPTFFMLGQTLPTHRLAFSPYYGGPFQSTMTEAIRILSRRPFASGAQPSDQPATRHGIWPFRFSSPPEYTENPSIDRSRELSDPFTSSQLTYSTNEDDSFPSPSAYLSRRHGWVHIFPEGRIHQHPQQHMRYFKWGVARLILEAEPCPDLVPIWIEGFDAIMHEERTFPRPLPRPGKSVSVTFGGRIDMVAAGFVEMRARWREMVRREKERDADARACGLGECPVSLEEREDAVRLREEVTMRVRDEVLKLRVQRGWPEEDPKARLVDTWREEGRTSKREGRMKDGSIVKEAGL
ncbi:hypothetical protein FH972_023891 [Carpinus fangiana]|uniref:Tafazzin family protein n=1 Tax=Carpinus fangiana TaxID=176857 RepID=A0A5N6KWZ2_9ROSI|nr:hypothetical protein FH972_023891 [Carpinus fangiana]